MFVPSQKVLVLRNKLIKFMEEHIYPMENEFYKLAQSDSRWTVHPVEEKLKEMAKKEGLWNLWNPVCILIFLFFTLFYLYSMISEAFLIHLSGLIYCCFLLIFYNRHELICYSLIDLDYWYISIFTIFYFLLSKFTLFY